MDKYTDCYNRLAIDDLSKPFDNCKRDRRHIPLRDFIGDVHDKVVLDVGCADGQFLSLLEARKKYGIDIALPYLKNFKDNSWFGPAPKTFLHNAEQPFPKEIENVDVVIASDILEHVLNPDKVLKNIMEVMKPDALLYVAVPYNEDLTFYEQYTQYKFTHLRQFNESNIPQFFEGFTIVERRASIPKPPFKNKWLKKGFKGLLLILGVSLSNYIFIELLGYEPVHLFIKCRMKEARS